jgi:hypothetical protein
MPFMEVLGPYMPSIVRGWRAAALSNNSANRALFRAGATRRPNGLSGLSVVPARFLSGEAGSFVTHSTLRRGFARRKHHRPVGVLNFCIDRNKRHS